MMFIESIRIRSSTQYSKAELIYFHKDSAQTILDNPVDIVLIAIPLLIQTYLIFVLTYYWMKKWKQPHCVAAPGSMIGASNFFELAVAVAISTFGMHSGVALATLDQKMN